jgi:hypothetical protein
MYQAWVVAILSPLFAALPLAAMFTFWAMWDERDKEE